MSSDLPHRVLAGWVDPAVAFTGLFAAGDAFWLDAGPDAPDGWSWVGSGIPSSSPRDVIAAGSGDRAAGPFRGGWVGWAGYDAAAARAGAPAAIDPGPEELWLRVERMLGFDHSSRRVLAFAPADRLAAFVSEVESVAEAPLPSAGPAPHVEVTARHEPEEYAGLIEQCRDEIREGRAYQLCLTTRFETAASVDPVGTYLRLRAATPAHHGGFIRSGGWALVSASPEQFLAVDDGIVRTRPIKGTRPRSAEPERDGALAADLRASVKEQAENVMIVDLMRNDLQRVCVPGSVAAERLLEVESYPAVHQLVSTVAGRLRPGTTVGRLWDAAFPAGSMTGAPKLSAMQILHRLEAAPRGVFSGCFGWIGDDGGMDLAMVIRSIVVHPDGAYVGAGGGITWGSVAADEVAEVGIKARAPLRALGADLPPGW
ncbi:anthranilate synthase component I family protein [Microbacterium sp. KSW4-11]|uniref:Anthranilate synthase component I family protein n=1 Tax=Microbacterium gawkjiense TaxID=3067309 RepID=A0ABU3GB04_9MICO|nr:anthranilate synthase component I family protein [Microbacterium sp. KSW4-11]MDT3316994.1 anthranilate synthase component I family protein [Microbacterium sp. KSW4-11]